MAVTATTVAAATTMMAAVAAVFPAVDAARVRGGLRRLLGCGGASPPPPPHQHEHADRDIEMGLAAGGETSSPAKSPHPSS
ncbi:Os07g0618000 [Oryza sativa Japonica Group]|uniref:Os07g0618000 protein n=3 Tax=Oryza sativa TaxID=4530 RepID=Q7EZ64_ORYSJ|nr:hypothetical protein EE612_040704 [Oryza sativa]BAC79867.1 unknown protein [Oryza sativa Japonica Group]BAC79996.1 unknown protein [Oryza sativa Japonica Group]BAF22199.1 Os07g0618000 [Oryza sativa Japonica Group]BAT02666.1 Os07g0618000 [Oryza sativa Japonica Group]|eukprot:NP_001060285.1 Os07g0618000 [Oryza sativa Japonica Group]